MWTKARWTNGKTTISGRWYYDWSSDKYFIRLDTKDPVTDKNRRVISGGETPEWGNWKLIDGEQNGLVERSR